MSVTCQLDYDGTYNVTLPLPAHSKTIDIQDHEDAHETGGGDRYTVKHGPTRYVVEKKFETLTDTQAKSLMTLFNQIGRGTRFYYKYTPHGGVAKSVSVWFEEPPKITENHRDNWDASIRFRQTTIPNRESDANA